MAYCSVGNVTASFKRVPLNATSEPTLIEAAGFCEDISLEMDAKIQTLGITVPVTSADAVRILKDTAVNGVIAKILRSVEMEVDAAQMYQRLYENKMKNIVENPEMLSTSVSDDSPGYQDSMHDRKFKMSEREW